jgi:BMFP domain-containing protein YqiC
MTGRSHVNKLAWCMMLCASVATAAGQARAAERVAISAQQIADAMAATGATVRAAQVKFISQVSASTEGSRLEVVSVKNHDAQATVKLRCRNRQECLPFYVLVEDVGPTPPVFIPVKEATRQGTRQAPGAALPLAMVRGGDRATLVLESSDLRISLPVICLQSGGQGQKVRVSSPDHKQFFEGEVVAAGFLKGRL